jgi:hypothetical protein
VFKVNKLRSEQVLNSLSQSLFFQIPPLNPTPEHGRRGGQYGLVLSPSIHFWSVVTARPSPPGQNQSVQSDDPPKIVSPGQPPSFSSPLSNHPLPPPIDCPKKPTAGKKRVINHQQPLPSLSLPPARCISRREFEILPSVFQKISFFIIGDNTPGVAASAFSPFYIFGSLLSKHFRQH